MLTDTWTRERVEQLRNFVKAGMTCSEIAGEIGVTRNAVIGKIHRLGLAPGRTAAAPARERPPRVRRPRLSLRGHLRLVSNENGAPTPVREPDIAIPIESVQRCSLLDLAHGRCRWPLNDPGHSDFAFCGNATLAHFSYCPGHARLAYRVQRRA
jgi:GcrA cell cycle regulator